MADIPEAVIDQLADLAEKRVELLTPEDRQPDVRDLVVQRIF